MFPRTPSPTGHKTPASAQDLAAGAQVDWALLLAHAELARCCPARPTVVAVFSPRHGRSRAVDLLLYGHHYRASHASMAQVGAKFYRLPPS